MRRSAVGGFVTESPALQEISRTGIPSRLRGGSRGMRKRKLFLEIEINNESVKPATIAIISANYFAERRLNLSTTIMETT